MSRPWDQDLSQRQKLKGLSYLGTQEYAFLTSFLEMLLLLVWRPQFENNFLKSLWHQLPALTLFSLHIFPFWTNHVSKLCGMVEKFLFFLSSLDKFFFWTDPWWNMEKNMRAKSHTKSYLPPTATTQSQGLCWFPIKGNYRWIEENNFRSNREFKLHWLIQLPFELILWIIYLSKSIYKLVVFTVRKHFPIQTLHSG